MILNCFDIVIQDIPKLFIDETKKAYFKLNITNNKIMQNINIWKSKDY